MTTSAARPDLPGPALASSDSEIVLRELDRPVREIPPVEQLNPTPRGGPGGRAAVAGAEGSWNRFVDSTNQLIDDMARPTSEMARVIGGVANGDLSERMTLEMAVAPIALALAKALAAQMQRHERRRARRVHGQRRAMEPQKEGQSSGHDAEHVAGPAVRGRCIVGNAS